MKHQHRTHLRALVAAGALATVAGCGGSATPPGSAVTVTVTPTVTAQVGGPTASTTAHPTSDDIGRRFDYGAVVSAKTVAGIAVLVLDRYTWKGLDDAKLAQQGLPVKPFSGKKLPYENLNTALTYRLPVADGARILYHHCAAADQPLQTKSIAATDLVGLHAPENTVLVSLDAQGRVTAAENIPACPS